MKKILLIAILISLLISHNAYAQTLNLNDCLNIALSHNQSVIDAQEKVNAANAKLGQSVSNFLPKLSLSASKGLNYVEMPTPNQASDVTSYSLNVQQTLFAGGKVIAGWQIADVSYQISREELRRIKNETVFNVTASFYDLLKVQKGLLVINESIANLKRNIEQTQVFYDSGIGSNIDLLRVKTQLANSNINRIQAENGVKLAGLALENILGQKLPSDFELKEDEFKKVAQLELSQDDALDLAYKNRPEWRSYNLAMEIARKALNIAYGGFLPNIAYLYSIGRTKSEYPTAQSSNSDLSNWRSMFVASWTLFDGFFTVNQIREAKANYNSAAAQQENIRNGIELEVNSAYLNLKSAEEKIAAAQTAAELADKTLKTVEISYRSNIASEQNYLDAHTVNEAAQLNLISAKYDYEVARAKLNKSIGKD